MLKGKVDAELSLFTEKEANESPAGLGRNPPQQLLEPDRPQTSFLWFTSPFKSFRFVIWKNYKWIIIKITIGVILVLFVLIFFYQLPSALISQVFSKIG
jgi:hypothetical protein